MAAPAAVRDDLLLPELARWIRGFPDDLGERTAGWDDATWARLRQLILMHGVAAVLTPQVPGAGDALPEAIAEWLREQEDRIARRADRMQAELAAILGRAAERGVEVIPLKGAYLADVAAVEPRRRPMADLDLLVRPAQREAMRKVLRELGYVRWRHPEVGPKPETFLSSGGRTVVDRSGEHPDNPRPVELHLAVQRHLWEWLAEDQLTPAFWASAKPGEVLGQPAMLPPMGLVFEHLAVHATTNVMRGRARLLQWLDLARLAAAGAAPPTWVVPRLAYPSLELAARVHPGLADSVDLAGLAAASEPAVRDWARATPLDGSAGLETGKPRIPPRGVGGQRERWRPSRLRLAVAYGSAPLPVALGRLGFAATRYGVRYGAARLPRPARRLARRSVRGLAHLLRRLVDRAPGRAH